LYASSTALSSEEPSSAHFVLAGATLVGGVQADVEVADGVIVAVGEGSADAERVDVRGLWIGPAFIDSHVHLAYRPGPEALAVGGVAGVVDMASPLEFLTAELAPLQVRASGPMVTAVGGYPTQSWGAGGYGVECADAEAAEAAVARLHTAGAKLVKLPVTGGPVLDAPALAAAVAAAQALGMRVASHALEDTGALAAAEAGADVLAHTPTEAMASATLAAWSGRAVVSTLAAFGGGPAADANLAALRARGATVLYGTDYGNTSHPGIDPDEIALLAQAGLDGPAILAAGTSMPAAYWGFDTLGSVAVGQAASLLVLGADPLLEPLAWTTPVQVYVDGVAQATR
jgi:imidazolonepropionase-like amidohydrolase